MAQNYTDPAAADPGDWFTQNAPQAAAPQKATAENVALMYRNLLGREGTPQEIQSTLQGGSYDLDTIQGSIASSAEAKSYSQAHPQVNTATGGAAPTLNRNDPASVAAYVGYYANQPGANPSLKNDPNYWIGKISSGELGNDPGYIVSKFMLPEGAPAGSNRYGSLGGADPSAGFGAPPAPYASNPNAPTYTPPTLPAWLSSPYEAGKYTAPTGEEVLNEPGYAFGLEQGTKQINRSAAARGTVLNPGTVQALNRYGTDYATTKYDDAVARGLGIFNTNESARFGARQQNENEYQQNVVGPNQQNYFNQYGAYLNENARTLNDYLTNYGIQHTADTDYWGRLKDVSNSGLTASLGDRAA